MHEFLKWINYENQLTMIFFYHFDNFFCSIGNYFFESIIMSTNEYEVVLFWLTTYSWIWQWWNNFVDFWSKKSLRESGSDFDELVLEDDVLPSESAVLQSQQLQLFFFLFIHLPSFSYHLIIFLCQIHFLWLSFRQLELLTKLEIHCILQRFVISYF